MPSLSSTLLCFTIMAIVCCSLGLALPLSNDQKTLFYVFGSEAIYTIDPESKTVLSTIAAEGICTQSNNRYSSNECSFGGEILVKEELIFFSDMPGNRVHVIDVEKGKVVETIPTEGYPYDLYYIPWMEEVWVHTWTNATFDVINVAGKLKRTHKAIKAHVQPGWTHGYMYADQQVKEGNVGYVTHLFNPGVHLLNLTSKSYKDFVNVSSYGCTGTFNLAYSSVNKHVFFDCYSRSRSKRALLEMDVATDQIVRKWNFTGVPHASPDGRFIVATYKYVNETANRLIDSKVYVLIIPDKDSAPTLKSKLQIPSGVSYLVFDKKAGKQGGFLAYISLVYSDKIAVLDLDFLESGNAAAVSYIEGVGSVFSAPGMHSVYRPLLVSGSWLVTPATADKSVAIINIATQKLHGMVSGVVEGGGLIAVRKTPSTPKAGATGNTSRSQVLICVLLSVLFMVVW